MANRNTSPALAAAKEYLRKGWQPIPVPLGQKAPCLKSWQNIRLSQDELPSHFQNDTNIGILLGEASGGLGDVDLDAPEVIAVADEFLPRTGRVHGRKNKCRSHRWYVFEPSPQSRKFADTDGTSLVELRSSGQQTLVPPSVHPSGELLQWEDAGDPARIDPNDLYRAVSLVAAASLLARHWPDHGSRHEAALAMHGFLLRASWPTEQAEHFVGTVARAAGDEEWTSRAGDARTTARRLAGNGAATGRIRLAEMLGEDVVDRASEWLGMRRNHDVGEHKVGLTDLSNAKRFALAHGKDVRFCHRWKKWFIWDGRQWAEDDRGEIQRRAKLTAIAMLSEAANEPNDEPRSKLLAWEKQSESEHSLRALVTLGRSEEGIPVRVDELDCHPMLFNCHNGTVDLATGEFREHRRQDMITKLAPVIFDANAKCPQWLAFLNRIMEGNKELTGFLQRAAGYSLTGDTREHALFLLYGTGANGKTTFLEVLRHVWGDYVMSADFSSFIITRGPSVRNDLARLAGARLVTAVESEANRRLAEEVIKQITGGDTITARYLYSEHFEFRPQFKLFLATNHKPRIRGTDAAIWRRIHLVPFTVSIPIEEQDKTLPKRLCEEASGILRWALEGLSGWKHVGLAAPSKISEATSDYRSEQDVLQHFFDDRCVRDAEAQTPASDLYEAYRKWCDAAGESPFCKREFGLALQERGFRKARSGESRKWIGIKINRDFHDA